MREFRGSEIRNVAVVGHGASGKTSLVDALAFVSGASKRHGSVKDGTALTDYSAVEVGTERMFREAVRRKDPVLFVVSMMDKEHADFDRAYSQIKDRLTAKVIPVEVPIGQGAEFHGVVN